MDNNNTSNELQLMREQLDILKTKLKGQEIVNEKLMRKSMGRQVSWIKKYVIMEVIMVPFLLLIFAGFHATTGISWWLFGFLAVMLIADVAGDIYVNRMKSSELLSGDLISVSRHYTKMKQLRARTFAIGVVAVIIWVAWLAWEIFKMQSASSDQVERSMTQGMAVGTVVGGAIGLIIAFFIFHKMQKTNDKVIRQIEEMQESEN